MRCVYCFVKKADYIVKGNSICEGCLIDIGKGKETPLDKRDKGE